MRAWIFAVVLMGCTTSISRDRAAYSAELTFIDRVVRGGATANHDVVVNGCACTGAGEWRSSVSWATDAQCAARAEWWVVYTARWAWHHAMMLFNSGLSQTRPGSAPAIPAVTCTLPPVTP